MKIAHATKSTCQCSNKQQFYTSFKKYFFLYLRENLRVGLEMDPPTHTYILM